MSEPRHDSGQTSTSLASGEGGKHSLQQSTGYPLGTRTQKPHHKKGWDSTR